MSPENQPPSSLAEQLEQAFTRPSGREIDQMREVRFQTGIAPHANGSVICSFGHTQVICAAMIEDRVPGWMRQQKVEGGWLTAGMRITVVQKSGLGREFTGKGQ